MGGAQTHVVFRRRRCKSGEQKKLALKATELKNIGRDLADQTKSLWKRSGKAGENRISCVDMLNICIYVICIYMLYVYVYVCMYVCMYVCTYVRMYVCTHVRMCVCTYVFCGARVQRSATLHNTVFLVI